jgi:hypothetical protein
LTPAQKMLRYRRRLAAGKIILRVEIDEGELVDCLVRRRLLDNSTSDDRAALARAVELLLQLFIAAPDDSP